MADNFQEVLQIVFEIAGQEGVDKVTAALKSLGDTSDFAGTPLGKAADEIDRLTTTAGKIDGLIAQKAALAEVSTQLDAAKDRYSALDKEIENASVVTTKMYNDYRSAESSVVNLTARHSELANQLAVTSASLNNAGVDTEHLDSAQRNIQTSLVAAGESAIALAKAHNQSSAAQKEEAVSVQSLSEKYGLFGKVVDNVKTILATVGSFFALEKAKEELEDILATGDKFQKFGIDFANAFGGAEKGQAALEKVKELAEATPLSLDEVAAAAIKAKKEGLDPFDGTLQALIDTNAKYGGSVDTLNGLIEGLGRAYNRGSLSTRELVQLQQQGIPVTQILGQALGKTADEIQDMAKKSELGRDSIRLLISQLGASAAGDASKQMGLLGTLITKVKDEWEEFLNLIAQSGAYDYVRDKLQSINAALKQGLGDGTLKEKAQAISNAIVGIGQAISGTLKFLYDHATALANIARGYVVLRTAMLALDLVGAATKFAGLTGAIKEGAAAAEVAAAEGGVFARLGAKISAIPKGIQIAIAVAGADYAVSTIERVLDVSKQLEDLNTADKRALQDLIELRGVLATKAADLSAKLKGYADVQLASADALAKKNRTQSEDYIASLQNATRYYAALRVQADAKSDYPGVVAATDKLRALAIAMGLAKDHLKDLTDALNHTGETIVPVIDKFDKLRTQGQASATAIEGAFNKIEINTPKGLQDTIDIIRNLSIRSADAKVAVQTELVGALEKLDSADLRAFQENVTQRLRDAKGDADALKLALQAGLEAELLRLGLTAQQAGVQFTAGGQKIIDTFADITRNATASGDQIQLAFAKALSQAQTKGEVDALKQQLQAAFDAGKLSADQFAIAMQAAGRKTADVQVGAITASASLDGVGKAGQTAAQRISASMQDARDQLVAQANQIAAALGAALQSGADPQKIADLKAQFAAVDAQLQSLNQRIAALPPSFDDAGNAGEKAGRQIAAGANEGAAALAAEAAAAKQAEAAVEATAEKTNLWDSTLKDISFTVAGLSPLAVKAVQDIQKAAEATQIGVTGQAEQYVQVVNDGIGRINQAIEQQKAEVAELTDEYTNLSATAHKSDTDTAATLQKRADSLAQFSAQLKNGTSQFNYLDQQSLANLEAQVDATIAKTQALADAAKAAEQNFANLAQESQDALDQANGNQKAIEDRRSAAKLQELKDAATLANQLNSQTYQQAVANEEALHALNLKNIAASATALQAANTQAAQQQQTQVQTAQPTSAGSGATSFTSTIGAGIGGGLTPQQPATVLAPINIHVNGQQQTQVFGTPTAAQTLASVMQQLALGKMLSVGTARRP